MPNESASTSVEIGGKVWNWSMGGLAPQAGGSVTVRVGDTIVLATVVMSNKVREGIDYLPLLVDYEEKLYAAGKIKGSRWVKREGRPSDDAILKGRVIDRTLRPMFNSKIRNDIQVVTTVLCVDGENDPDIVALNAASAAIEVSDIPWDGPVAGVRVGKVDGKLVLNPSFAQVESSSSLDLIVSGTGEHIVMIEAGAKEVSEEEIIEAVEFAQKEIKKIVAAVKDLAAKAAPVKRTPELFQPSGEITEKIAAAESRLLEAIYQPDRKQREAALEELKKELTETLTGEDESLVSHVNYAFESQVKKLVQKGVLEQEKRVDGRKLDEVRKITCNVALLPRVHGSGLFQRGETQVLTTVTLGGPGDEQILEDIETEEERKKRYIHHYNMPGFASGEVSPMRSPGRREIGHGALAERALEPMIPPKETFPYTLRLVSEVLSSNGSTSMASTCGSTLALMDAGIPIKAPVSGIAMGLILDEKTGQFKILTDIMGFEDANGHMDFKVAGTKEGITALQLDIKVKGLTVEILRNALSVAHGGRMHIMEKMLQAIAQPRAELSPYAPRVVSFRIDPSKIRTVIGPGGKVINQIIDETGVKIDIEDDGMVVITSTNEEASKKAEDWIKNITREFKPGEKFEGVVKRILDFGAMVEIVPGQEGLIHISELAPYRVDKVTDVVKVGDSVKVIIKEIDELGRVNLSRKALLPPGSGEGEGRVHSGPPRFRNDRPRRPNHDYRR